MTARGIEPDAAAWAALVARAPRAGGGVYAVTGTGIFCRFGCPARTPLRASVRLFSGPEAARAAGFRPCRRCRPAG